MNEGGWSAQIENIARACRTSGRSRLAALKTRASVFAALGDETRLSVLAKLARRAAVDRAADGGTS